MALAVGIFEEKDLGVLPIHLELRLSWPMQLRKRFVHYEFIDPTSSKGVERPLLQA